MHIEARLFEFVAAFFIFCTVLYGVLTSLFATGGIEWAGTTALALTSGMALIVATFFRFVARRLDTRPVEHVQAGHLAQSLAGGRHRVDQPAAQPLAICGQQRASRVDTRHDRAGRNGGVGRVERPVQSRRV